MLTSNFNYVRYCITVRNFREFPESKPLKASIFKRGVLEALTLTYTCISRFNVHLTAGNI